MKKSFLVFMISIFLCSMLPAGSLYHNAWSAAKDADSFLVVKINEQRQIVAQYMLPQNSKAPHNMQTSSRFSNLKSGTYIFPVKSGIALRFSYPELNMNNPENTYSLLMRFKQLQTKDEASFIMGNLLNQQSGIRFAALKQAFLIRHLIKIRHLFSKSSMQKQTYPFPKRECYWKRFPFPISIK